MCYVLGPATFCRFWVHGTTQQLTKLAVRLNTMAQWCTFWRCQAKACVRIQGNYPRGIMCLLVDVVPGVQALRKEPRLQHTPILMVLAREITGYIPTMGIAAALLVHIAAAILIYSWQMRGVDGKSTTPSFNLHGRSLIGRPTTLSKCLPPWRLRICVEI